MTRILYLKWSGIGDVISSIPKLQQLKAGWNHVSWLFTENFNPAYLDFLNLLKERWLIDEVLSMPMTLLGAFLFGLSHFRSFDQVFIGWLASRKNIIFSWIIGKSVDYRLRSSNKRIGLVQAENDDMGISNLIDYDMFKTADFMDVRPEIRELSKYVILFPNAQEKSLPISEWKGIVEYLKKNGIQSILAGGGREEWLARELWSDVFDLTNKTSFYELVFVLKNSLFNICVDGGVAWLSNLVNRRNINIHTFNAYIWEQPVDGVNSFNLRKYHYKDCKPCEGKCKFSGTSRYLECLSYTKKEDVIDIISKHYLPYLWPGN